MSKATWDSRVHFPAGHPMTEAWDDLHVSGRAHPYDAHGFKLGWDAACMQGRLRETSVDSRLLWTLLCLIAGAFICGMGLGAWLF